MHEGEVVEPTDEAVTDAREKADLIKEIRKKKLNPAQQIRLEQVYCSEFPQGFWDLVAMGVSFQPDHLSCNQRNFPVIGAYNGHAIKDTQVGRIVVDSSFHHWVDVNLTGSLLFNSAFPPPFLGDRRKLFGFLTVSGLRSFEKIRRYHRNVALWLAPPKKQRELAIFALWRALDLPEIKESLSTDLTPYEIGKLAIPFLSSTAGEIIVRSWWFQIETRRRVLKLIKTSPDNVASIFPTLDEFMTGGILRSMMFLKEDLQNPNRRPSFKQLKIEARLGLQKGLFDFIIFIRGQVKDGKKVLRDLSRGN